VLPWLIALPLLGGLLGAGVWYHLETRTPPEADNTSKRNDSPGEITLKQSQAEVFIDLEPAKAIEAWYEPVTVYGRVVGNPSATVELRAAFAGTLRQAGGAWPAPGQWVKAGDLLGWVDVRVGPQERLELQNKLGEAQLRLAGAEETRDIQQTRVKRLKAAGSSVPLRELQDAEVLLTEARTQENVARAAVELWKSALKEINRHGPDKVGTWSQPLSAPAAGEVAELAVQPGVAIETGGLILRLVDSRQCLVRLDLPPETLVRGPPPTVELLAAATPPPALRGARNQSTATRPPPPITAILVGPAPGLDAATQFAGYFYKLTVGGTEATSRGVDQDGIAWRSGLFVRAEVSVPPAPGAEPSPAVAVPESALVYHQGRALVYVLKHKDAKTVRFARREVQVLGHKEGQWVLAFSQDLQGGDQVVVSGAQRLLSIEFLSAADDD
jgi:multidrug efflux pump subunit AcrA (membrane-fusion protein)